MKLDFSVKTKEGRAAYVNRMLQDDPTLTSQYKEYISDYLLFVADRQSTKREREEENPIITRNREVTVNKRQMSYEELVSKLENGEDGVYALISNDKNQLMDRKELITNSDVADIPGLKEQMDLIESLKKQFDKAQGYAKYALKRQIIETWQQAYIIKASWKGTPSKSHATNQIKSFAHMPLPEHVRLDEGQMPKSDCAINLFNPTHVSFLLCYYSQLKQECEDDLQSDMHWLLIDLENLAVEAIREKDPILWDVLVWKVDGYTNTEIKEKIERQYGVTHNEQYYSTLWRKRIPKLITEQASKNWLMWYYTMEEYGKWKVCGQCGKTKLAHHLFFTRNKTHDGLYSICKECRSSASNTTE